VLEESGGGGMADSRKKMFFNIGSLIYNILIPIMTDQRKISPSPARE